VGLNSGDSGHDPIKHQPLPTQKRLDPHLQVTQAKSSRLSHPHLAGNSGNPDLHTYGYEGSVGTGAKSFESFGTFLELGKLFGTLSELGKLFGTFLSWQGKIERK
jgi:hypothetical protein